MSTYKYNLLYNKNEDSIRIFIKIYYKWERENIFYRNYFFISPPCFIIYQVFVFVFSKKYVILCYGEKYENWKYRY